MKNSLPEKFNYTVRRVPSSGSIFIEVIIQEIKRQFFLNRFLSYDDFINFKKGNVNRYIENLDKIIRYVLKFGYHNSYYHILWNKYVKTGLLPYSKPRGPRKRNQYPTLTPFCENGNLKFRVYFQYQKMILNSQTLCDEHDLYNAQHYPKTEFEREINRMIDKTYLIIYNMPFDKEAIKEAFDNMIKRVPVYV